MVGISGRVLDVQIYTFNYKDHLFGRSPLLSIYRVILSTYEK